MLAAPNGRGSAIAPAASQPDPTALRTEATAPERRVVALAVVVVNVAFLVVELAAAGPIPALVAGRLVVSGALLLGWLLTGRPLSGAALRGWLAGLAALATAGLALVAWGTGGAQSPLAFFLPVLPIVVGIIVPDEPAAPLAVGATGLLAALLMEPAGVPATRIAFFAAAYVSCTFYGWVAALLYRRLRRRERATAEARERALADLHRSEDRRALSERLASLGRLAAGVAHEMNNPLAFVGTNLAFVEAELGARGAADAELLEALQESRSGLERMKRIVQELRGFARGRDDAPGPTDALEAVEAARRTLAARLDGVAEVTVRAAPGLPLVLAHRAELVQVLVNLLANAAEAVEAAGGGRGRVVVELGPVEGGLQLCVCDSGPGLSAEAQAHAFEPFFSTKGPGGTGLGLALSREFVERWGGRIEAGNRAEGGARVAVTLRRGERLGGEGPEGDPSPAAASG